MFELEQSLEKRLKRLRVRIDVPDSDTFFLRNVPARKDCFNKPRTNLLIKRPGAGRPFLVCVDEDLEYTGTDNHLLRAFTGAHKQQGWRVIYLAQETQGDVQLVVENALRVLGFDGEGPALDSAIDNSAINDGPTMPDQQGRLLAGFATDISARAREGNAEPTIGREEKIDEAVLMLLQWQARLPVIVGKSGVGKTNLLYGVARRLVDLQPERRVLVVDLAVLMAGTLFDSERENLLAALLREALVAHGTVLVMEHLEHALSGVPRGLWLLSQALEQGLRLAGTVLSANRLAFEPLTRRIQIIELAELWPEEMLALLLTVKERIAQHHRVGIDESIVHAALENARRITGCLPAKAINLLDAAAVKAALAGQRDVRLSDLYASVNLFPQPLGLEEPH